MTRDKLKAVLFDLDGTLVDTADEFVVVVQQLRSEHGMSAMDPARIRASVSNGARALVALGLGIDPQDPVFESKRLRLLELYSDVLGSAALPYPGIPPLLTALAERGIAWGVATNKPRAYAEPLMVALGLLPGPDANAASTRSTAEYCGSLVCPDDVSERKPHPESLYLNCRELQCAPHEAIYVGDHLRDIEAGRRAGMYTVAAAYGYIEPDDNADDWGANARVDCSHQLTDLILNL
ncbi:HAD family hydrolase [Pseudohalioglobus lutimaris]|uniref:Phosphoglycolate phosphatase n=1 Tax=Pseudohalioglobus lutimaris TaxID=1737061 RepID=A0A2N5X5J0_9GAMM|nr:HAD-IA family hydrolase [Pseudohalioglobus lutimaris]PLW69756.1 phosphoglycolate phosphatase [Pseudohalioglobus lutimaris]